MSKASPLALMLQQQIAMRAREDSIERERVARTYRTRRALGVRTRKMRAKRRR